MMGLSSLSQPPFFRNFMLCSIEELVQMGKLGFIQAILEHDKAMLFKKIRGGALQKSQSVVEDLQN